jgi:hypothetical protein
MHFDLTDQEAASFLAFKRFTTLEGPLRLVRFTDSGRGHEAGRGTLDRRTGIYRGYWMYAEDVAELLDDASGPGPYGLATIRRVSERWAICDDWGDLQRAWVLDVHAGETVDGWFGAAKFQPRTSIGAERSGEPAAANSYGGGAVQFVLGLTAQNVKWIVGPLPTLTLSRRKLEALRR